MTILIESSHQNSLHIGLRSILIFNTSILPGFAGTLTRASTPELPLALLA